MDHVLRYHDNPEVKMMVVLGEVRLEPQAHTLCDKCMQLSMRILSSQILPYSWKFSPEEKFHHLSLVKFYLQIFSPVLKIIQWIW